MIKVFIMAAATYTSCSFHCQQKITLNRSTLSLTMPRYLFHFKPLTLAEFTVDYEKFRSLSIKRTLNNTIAYSCS